MPSTKEDSANVCRAPLLLVVEDDFDSREALAEVLRDSGYRVVCAASGLEAIDYLAHHPPPSAIVTDMMMPDMDGSELTESLRNSEGLASTPTIVMSGSAPERAHPGMRFLRKPFALADLLDALATIVPNRPAQK